MRNPGIYCNRCLGIIDDPIRSCYVCLECKNFQDCSTTELYALLENVLARVECPIYRALEIGFPIVSTQNEVIRRMQRTLRDIATDIHFVLDRNRD